MISIRSRAVSWILTLTLVFTTMFGSTGMVFAGTSDTSADLTISTVEEFEAFATAVNNGDDYADKTVKLTANIDLNGKEWTPIGNGSRDGSSYTGNAFKGYFDGGNYTISNLTITKGESAAAVGLFGVVDGGAVKNLTMSGVSINLENNKNAGAAIGVMVNDTTAQNIAVSGTVTAVDGVGGVVGRMTISGTISDCTNNATVTATAGGGAGGIVGKAYYTGVDKVMTISNCTNNGTVTSGYAAGGIVALSAADVSNCSNSAAISASTEAGGIIGEQVNRGTVSGNTNAGNISNKGTGGTAYGGIIGWIRYQTSTSDYPTAANAVVAVTNNTNSGDISASGSSLGSGGIVGSIYNQATVTGNTNTAEKIVGGVFAAGIVGGPQYADNNVKISDATIVVSNNVSTTDVANITANCVAADMYNNDKTQFKNENNADAWVAQVGNEKFTTLQAAIDAATADEEVILINDFELAESVAISKEIILNLNGKTITGIDNVTKSFGLINVNPGASLTVKDSSADKTGAITLTAENNREWNAYSSVISNQRGKFVLESGTIEHLGGTDMAYGIDNLTNGKGTYAETVINGGTVKSTYRAIRQFLNGVEAQNILTINGGTIEGTNKSVWMQDANKSANPGTLTVAPKAKLVGSVYLYVTAGSTAWPVEVSIAKEALADGSEVIPANLPEGYELAESNGTYGVKVPNAVAAIGSVYYDSLQNAINAAKAEETITLVNDVTENVTVTQAPDYKITIDGNRKTMTGTITVDGKSAAYPTAGVTIKNLKFDATAITEEVCINLGVSGNNNTRYTSNVTVDNCTFTGEGKTKVAIKSYTGGDKNLTITNCKVTGMHSLVQLKNVEGVQVEGCTITDSKNGISVGVSSDVAIKDTTIDTVGYGVRADGTDDCAMTVTDCNITANQPVVVRNTTADYALTVEGGTLTPTTEGDYAVTITAGDDDAELVAPAATVNFELTVGEGVKAYPNELFVAKNGTKGYLTLKDAIDNATAGDTIELLADIDASEVILIDKSVTINGNGHKVTSSATRVFRVTVSDIEVTLNGVNMVSNAVMVYPYDVRGISVDGSLTDVNLTLNNCSVDFTDPSANDWAYAINVVDNGSGHAITVKGGTYEGANVINVRSTNSTVTVKDATLNCTYPTSDYYAGACIWVLEENGSSVEATGNTFIGSNAVAFNVGTGTALTESNNTDNTSYVVAKVDDTYYASLADAIAEADGETVTVLQDVEFDTITIEGTVTIVINNEDVTVTGTFVLADFDAELIAPEGLTVESANGHEVAYADGKYTVVKGEHHFSTEWSMDEKNHWNECTCGEPANKANHEMAWAYTPEIDVTKIDFTNVGARVEALDHAYVCEVCGWTDSETVGAHDFSVEVTKESTKEDPNGEVTLSCKVCDYEETKTFQEVADIASYLVAEYYDEAYAYAYEYADKEGYIDEAIEGIDAVVVALDEALAVANESGASDELKAELNAAYENAVGTAEQLKALIETADVLDDETYTEAVALLAELETNLSDFCSIMEQAGIDAADQLWIAYEYVKPIVIEQLQIAVEAGTEWLMDVLGELYDAFIAALPDIDKALYNWFYENPETVIGFFYEYGEELGYLFNEYGDELGAVLAYVLATYGPDAVEYAFENPEDALAKWAEWYNKHGVRALAMIDKYIKTLDEMGAFDDIKASLKDLAAEVEAYIVEYAEKVVAELEAKYNELSETAQAALAELKAAIEDMDIEAILAALEELEDEIAALYDAATSGNYIVTGDSYYVALGDTEAEYADIVADEMKLDAEQYVNAGIPGITAEELADLLAAGDEDLTSEIAKADFITVGFSNNTITAYAKDQVADLMARGAEDVDWEAAVGPNGAAAVEDALVGLEAAMAAEGMDAEAIEMVVTAVEAYAYACISFATNYPEVIDTIKDINSEAQVVIVGMYNPFENAVLEVEGTEIPVGEFVGALVDLANVHYLSYAMLTGNAVYVDAPAVETKAPFDKAMGIDEFVVTLADLDALEPNDAGNTYIAQQILKALNVVDKDAYNAMSLIEQIKDFGDVTRENLADAKELAEAARAAWDALTDEEKALIGLENYKVLVDFELAIAEVELGIAEDIAAAEAALKAAQAKADEIERALKITESTVTDLKAKVINKSQIKVTWEAADIEPDQYRVTLMRDGKKVGTYWVKGDKESVVLKNILRGTNFKVRVTPVAKVDGKKYFSIYKTSNKVKTQLQKANLTIKKAGLKKQIISKDQNSTGYQIWISTDKNFKKGVTKFTYKTNKKGLNVKLKAKNFKKGANYVKVRSYTKVNGKTVYGAWSGTVKTVK